MRLLAQVDAHEGPVYAPDEDALYFTAARNGDPRVAIKRLDLSTGAVSVLVERSNAANGMTMARDGRLLVCEQGTQETRAGLALVDRGSGAREVVLDAFQGRPLNSPNDVAVRSDGTIWFTDPSYGHLQGFRPPPVLGDWVYRHDPRTGTTEIVAHALDKPNGLCFGPGERVLYVTDTGRGGVTALDVDAAGEVIATRPFAAAEPEYPDGIKAGADGRVYGSSREGVQVFDPRSGALLGEIPLPGAVSFCFGGPQRDVLFVTTDTAVWAADID